MSDFFANMGGGFRFPDTQMNQGPLPSFGAGAPEGAGGNPDGRINFNSALLDGITPYNDAKTGRIGSDRNYQQIPHRLQKIVHKVYVPSADGFGMKVPVSHVVDQGDIAFVINSENTAALLHQSSHTTISQKNELTQQSVFVNLSTLNYLLAGLQRTWLTSAPPCAWTIFQDSMLCGLPENTLAYDKILHILRTRIIPFGICAGSEKQGGQNETGLAPVQAAANYVTTMTVDGQSVDLINYWAGQNLNSGDQLIFRLEQMNSKNYTLNHYYKEIVTQSFQEDSTLYQLVPDVFKMSHLSTACGHDYRIDGYWRIAQMMQPRKRCRDFDRHQNSCDDTMNLKHGGSAQLLQVLFAPVFMGNKNEKTSDVIAHHNTGDTNNSQETLVPTENNTNSQDLRHDKLVKKEIQPKSDSMHANYNLPKSNHDKEVEKNHTETKNEVMDVMNIKIYGTYIDEIQKLQRRLRDTSPDFDEVKRTWEEYEESCHVLYDYLKPVREDSFRIRNDESQDVTKKFYSKCPPELDIHVTRFKKILKNQCSLELDQNNSAFLKLLNFTKKMTEDVHIDYTHSDFIWSLQSDEEDLNPDNYPALFVRMVVLVLDMSEIIFQLNNHWRNSYSNMMSINKTFRKNINDANSWMKIYTAKQSKSAVEIDDEITTEASIIKSDFQNYHRETNLFLMQRAIENNYKLFLRIITFNITFTDAMSIFSKHSYSSQFLLKLINGIYQNKTKFLRFCSDFQKSGKKHEISFFECDVTKLDYRSYQDVKPTTIQVKTENNHHEAAGQVKIEANVPAKFLDVIQYTNKQNYGSNLTAIQTEIDKLKGSNADCRPYLRNLREILKHLEVMNNFCSKEIQRVEEETRMYSNICPESILESCIFLLKYFYSPIYSDFSSDDLIKAMNIYFLQDMQVYAEWIKEDFFWRPAEGNYSIEPINHTREKYNQMCKFVIKIFWFVNALEKNITVQFEIISDIYWQFHSSVKCARSYLELLSFRDNKNSKFQESEEDKIEADNFKKSYGYLQIALREISDKSTYEEIKSSRLYNFNLILNVIIMYQSYMKQYEEISKGKFCRHTLLRLLCGVLRSEEIYCQNYQQLQSAEAISTDCKHLQKQSFVVPVASIHYAARINKLKEVADETEANPFSPSNTQREASTAKRVKGGARKPAGSTA